MTEPNSNVHDYHDPDGGVGTSDNVARPNEFLDICVDDYEQPCGENIMFNVEGNNDHPSRWGGQNTQIVYDPSQQGPSTVHDQSGGQNAGYFDQENYAYESSTQLFEGPAPSLPYDCSFCQVLRYIVHLKGEEEITKLEIHGRIGMICHGILEICRGDMISPNKEYQTFDFCQKSISEVKEFLEKYFEDRTNACYTMVNDPLLTFYDTLCVRSEWDWFYGETLQRCPGNIDTNQAGAQSDEVRQRKRTMKEQTELVKKLTLKDIAKYFHLRESDAAKCLGVSPSTVKKLCRNAGLERWPFRQVDAIATKIRDIMSRRDPADPSKKAEAEAEIQRVQRKKAEIYAPYK
ncbi:RWP-RK domain-containing protein [Heracleum sosnowskyi]|uniref:RWP-RK domain-containing protein n=1 Tax=Heracleum sosnowskyi TaxID=360622 RepID=A0AAD8HSQ6_9APIA|nr:RWP-RK domain-containing protein [Heracleum sosnowskyi]